MGARHLLGALTAVVLGVGATACGGDSTPDAGSAPTATAAGSAPLSEGTPPSPSASPSLSAQDVSDPGLASHVGPGKLSKATIRRLVQYFEDKVAKAYADGDADTLAHYLAGPMLSGNRATILLLNRQYRRNVFRIKVDQVAAQTNDSQHLIVDMTGDMILDYFVDSRTHKVLDNGLPGPSQLKFAIFLDRNPATNTWYWTGEQSEADGAGSTGAAQ